MTDLLENVARAICKIAQSGEESPVYTWREFLVEAQAVLNAIGESHVVVPKEPTEEMVSVIWSMDDMVWEKDDGTEWINWKDVPRLYRAMLSASQETSDG